MIAKVCDRKSRRDSWFENRLVFIVFFCPGSPDEGRGKWGQSAGFHIISRLEQLFKISVYVCEMLETSLKLRKNTL